MALKDKFQRAWNAFFNKDPTEEYAYKADLGIQTYIRPDRPRFSGGNERTIVTAVYNRIAMDVADIDIKHVRTDENGKYTDDMKSGLNDCLSLEANIDQTSRAFVQDICMSMMDEGVVAVVPVDTVGDPFLTSSYDIKSMRTGKIVGWFPRHVKVNVYNDQTGKREDILLPKSLVAIIENPLYAIMNEPNSIMQRLIRKLSMLDAVDEQSSSGKLDLIIQLPYTIKTEARQTQAEHRRGAIERQLQDSKYGIAYIDATEKVTQLNRPLENNLLQQVQYLTSMLYGQLGISDAILNGTADEKTMTNYYSRIIEPIIAAIANEYKRKFLTKTARTQNQSIMYFRDPFKLVPVTEVASIADSFTRNEILSPNEVRQIIGRKPDLDPASDQLRNRNLNQPDEQAGGEGEEGIPDTEGFDFASTPLSQLQGFDES